MQLGAGFFGRKIFRANRKESFAQCQLQRRELAEVGLEIGEKIDRRAFRDRAELQPAVLSAKPWRGFGTNSFRRCRLHSFWVRQMEVFAESFLRPEQFLGGIVIGFHPACDRGIAGEFAERIIVQETAPNSRH